MIIGEYTSQLSTLVIIAIASLLASVATPLQADVIERASDFWLVESKEDLKMVSPNATALHLHQCEPSLLSDIPTQWNLEVIKITDFRGTVEERTTALRGLLSTFHPVYVSIDPTAPIWSFKTEELAKTEVSKVVFDGFLNLRESQTAFLSRLPNLVSVEIMNCAIREAKAIENVCSLAHLQQLVVNIIEAHGVRMSDRWLLKLANEGRKLQELTLGGTAAVTEDGLLGVVKKCQIKKLHLITWCASVDYLTLMTGLRDSSLTELELDLFNTMADPNTSAILHAISKIEHLIKLELSGLASANSDSIGRLFQLSLKVLSLGGIHHDFVESIGEKAPAIQTLTELKLSGEFTLSEQLMSLLSKCPLERLSLEDMNADAAILSCSEDDRHELASLTVKNVKWEGSPEGQLSNICLAAKRMVLETLPKQLAEALIYESRSILEELVVKDIAVSEMFKQRDAEFRCLWRLEWAADSASAEDVEKLIVGLSTVTECRFAWLSRNTQQALQASFKAAGREVYFRN